MLIKAKYSPALFCMERKLWLEFTCIQEKAEIKTPVQIAKCLRRVPEQHRPVLHMHDFWIPGDLLLFWAPVRHMSACPHKLDLSNFWILMACHNVANQAWGNFNLSCTMLYQLIDYIHYFPNIIAVVLSVCRTLIRKRAARDCRLKHMFASSDSPCKVGCCNVCFSFMIVSGMNTGSEIAPFESSQVRIWGMQEMSSSQWLPRFLLVHLQPWSPKLLARCGGV